MTHDHEQTEVAFALQVLGLDGVQEGPADPSSMAGKLNAIGEQGRLEGWSQARIGAEMNALLEQQDREEARSDRS